MAKKKATVKKPIQPDPISLDSSLQTGIEKGALYPIAREQWLQGGTLTFSPEDGIYIGINPDYDARYRATFMPTWRPEINLDNDFRSVQDAQKGINAICAIHSDKSYNFIWQQVDADNWIATGHDGQVETNLPIAKIARVAGE